MEEETKTSGSGMLKKLIPIVIGLLVLMPMVGVGVVYFTTAAEKERLINEARERAALEEARRAELQQQAQEETGKRDLPALPRPEPKDG